MAADLAAHEAGRHHGLTRRRYKATTNSKHDLPAAANVVERTFDVEAIGRADRYLAGGITNIATRGGWLYLAVILGPSATVE